MSISEGRTLPTGLNGESGIGSRTGALYVLFAEVIRGRL
jgi:hypothetical protein